MGNLVYIDKVPSAYRNTVDNKVRDIASKLDINPNYIMIVFNSESGLNKSIVNSIGCVGLIQFCPDFKGAGYKTIQGKKYSMTTIKNMSWSEQIELCYKYWYSYRDSITSLYDLYLSTFYPLAMTKSDSWIFGSEKSMSYAHTVSLQNPAISNGSYYITKKQFKQYIDKKTNIAKLNIDTESDLFTKSKKGIMRNLIPITIFSVLIIGASYYVYQNKKLLK